MKRTFVRSIPDVAKDTELTYCTRVIYYILASHVDNETRTCKLYRETISKESGADVRAVDRALKHLESKNYIQIIHRYNKAKKKQQCNEYKLLDNLEVSKTSKKSSEELPEIIEKIRNSLTVLSKKAVDEQIRRQAKDTLKEDLITLYDTKEKAYEYLQAVTKLLKDPTQAKPKHQKIEPVREYRKASEEPIIKIIKTTVVFDEWDDEEPVKQNVKKLSDYKKKKVQAIPVNPVIEATPKQIEISRIARKLLESNIKYNELKDLCKERNIKDAVTKTEMIERLASLEIPYEELVNRVQESI
jgi:hypothetical protein